jgi:hypothetical protein
MRVFIKGYMHGFGYTIEFRNNERTGSIWLVAAQGHLVAERPRHSAG